MIRSVKNTLVEVEEKLMNIDFDNEPYTLERFNRVYPIGQPKILILVYKGNGIKEIKDNEHL